MTIFTLLGSKEKNLTTLSFLEASQLLPLVGQSIHPSSRAGNNNSCTGKEKDAFYSITFSFLDLPYEVSESSHSH